MSNDAILSKLTDSVTNSDRTYIEFFLVKMFELRLNQLKEYNLNINTLKSLMSRIPHFKKEEQFMMTQNYKQKQIVKTYKEVFVSIINSFAQSSMSELKTQMLDYLNLCNEEDLILFNNVIESFFHSKIAA